MSNFTRKKSIIVPVLKMTADTPIFVKFIDMVEKDKTDIKTGEVEMDNGKPKKICIATVVNLEDGLEYHLVLGTILYSTLSSSYNDVSGRCFEIIKKQKRAGKDYNDYELYEIEA